MFILVTLSIFVLYSNVENTHTLKSCTINPNKISCVNCYFESMQFKYIFIKRLPTHLSKSYG